MFNFPEVVDIDGKSERGWTALMFAARNGHTSVISTLIDKGYTFIGFFFLNCVSLLTIEASVYVSSFKYFEEYIHIIFILVMI